jgi:hypothetical protein
MFLENCYFDPTTKTYPITLEDIRSYKKNVSMPSVLDDNFITFLGLVRVVGTVKPVLKSVTDYLIEGIPIKAKDGLYHQTWISRKYDFNAGEFPQRFQELKNKKLEELATYRWNIEVAGIKVNDVEVKTDRESQSQLASAIMMIANKFANNVNWKGANGWVTLSENQVLEIGKYVSQFVQGCFNIERVHSEKIQKLETVEEVFSYDFTKGWGTNQFISK